MKKNYKELEYEVVRFEEEDVITASMAPPPMCLCVDAQVVICWNKDCNCISVEK
ncbi:MAG: hypothetical protein II000_02915 [Clostridia bacterium]|nr:hypothetical protein [Clostridia bacterium]